VLFDQCLLGYVPSYNQRMGDQQMINEHVSAAAQQSVSTKSARACAP
jgi:hypothetical protein